MGLSAAYQHDAVERSISDCNDIDHVSEGILQPLQDRLDACAAGFTLITIDQNRLVNGDLSIARGAFEALTPSYRNGMFHEDPLYRGCPEVPETLMRYVEGHEEEADRLRAYHDAFLKTKDINDCMGIYFKVKGVASNKIVSLSFGRGSGAKRFSNADRQALGQVGILLRLVLSNIALRHEGEWLWKQQQHPENGRALPRAGADGAYGLGDAAMVRPHNGLAVPAAGGPMLDEGVAAACRQFGITEREREIVALLKRGHSNLSMSHSLNISIRTVENHLRAIYAKTSVNSRTQLLYKINDNVSRVLSVPPVCHSTAH